MNGQIILEEKIKLPNMTLQELTEKAKQGPLSHDEQGEFIKLLDAEANKMREENPKEYLALLRKLNEVVSDFNKGLKQLAA